MAFLLSEGPGTVCLSFGIRATQNVRFVYHENNTIHAELCTNCMETLFFHVPNAFLPSTDKQSVINFSRQIERALSPSWGRDSWSSRSEAWRTPNDQQ